MKDIMRRRRTTRHENGVDWKGEDRQREDECKFNARELAFQRCTLVSGRTTRYCHTSIQMKLVKNRHPLLVFERS